MALQPMKIAHAVRVGAGIHDAASLREDVDINRAPAVPSLARRAKLVNAQVAGDMYWLSASDYGGRGDFPPIRLPFPEMWFEWVVPSKWRNEDGWHDLPYGVNRRYFAVAYEGMTDSSAPDGAHSTVEVFGGWLEETTGNVFIPDGILVAHVDEYGSIVGVVHDGDVFDGIGVIGGPEVDQRSVKGLIPAFLAIGLMNCKNVRTEEHKPEKASRKKRSRRDIPRISHHTIVLPSSPSTVGESGERQDVMPHHKVRGHFKTYTDDAPLMGKHVGTYWWGWQVRGNKKNGITVTDYKVGV